MSDTFDLDLIPGLGQQNQLTPRNSCLRILNGPRAGLELALDDVRMVIGRNDPPQVTVPIDLTACELGEEPMISRRHAEVHWIQGRIYLVDLGSRNGTRINGHPVILQEDAKISMPVELHLEDCITLADLELRLVRRDG
ncbi:MAG: FHA domain-containing protein [Magnetococcales bacterium]|nr:FHA domain-containing protein [Magnetococcales bacterium]